MTLTASSTITEVAAAVPTALQTAGIAAILTGGACAAIYSRGAYVSHDLDFIIRGRTTQKTLDSAMASVGFTRNGDRYIHKRTRFFVEFPRGPLAIGDDFDITPVDLKIGRGSTLALSATDSCRDRLAAFYHWSDRQSLRAAVDIARLRHVNLAVIARWSRREGFVAKHEEFRKALKQP